MEVVLGDRAMSYLLRGSRPETIVFLPALGTRASFWEPQLAYFSPRYTAVAPEMGGHSPDGAPPTLTRYADDLIHVLDAVGATWAHIVGLSLGGAIAQEFALRHPDRTLSLTLVNTTGRYDSSAKQAMLARADTVERNGMADVAGSAPARWFTPEYVETHEAQMAAVRQVVLSADPATYAAAARSIAAVDTLDRLPALAVPALVIHGEADVSIPRESSEALAVAIPGARMETLGGVAHLCPMQDPGAFNTLLDGFLRDASADEVTLDRSEPAHPW